MTLNMIEAELHHAMDRLSNREPVEVKEEWIDAAAEQFRQAMYKQFLPEDRGDFKLRMSNIGRPLCQLQMEKAGADKARLPYNHIMKMAIGDAVECIMEIIIRSAGLNVTGGKMKVELTLADTVIKGEDDIEIDGKVWDTKTCSPWAFEHKWKKGVSSLKENDGFGYLGQITGYSVGQGKQPGGWFVVNKSTGEVLAVPADLSGAEQKAILKEIEGKVSTLNSDAPFQRCFEPEEETFYRKSTGNKRIPMACTFCDFKKTCWPDAVYRPQTGSTAKEPRYHWYAEYADQT
jgi:hypothetical protein